MYICEKYICIYIFLRFAVFVPPGKFTLHALATKTRTWQCSLHFTAWWNDAIPWFWESLGCNFFFIVSCPFWASRRIFYPQCFLFKQAIQFGSSCNHMILWHDVCFHHHRQKTVQTKGVVWLRLHTVSNVWRTVLHRAGRNRSCLSFTFFIFGFFGGNSMKIFWLSLRWTCFHGKETEGGGALELHTCHFTVCWFVFFWLEDSILNCKGG